jgi:hypothetical protein
LLLPLSYLANRTVEDGSETPPLRLKPVPGMMSPGLW